MISLQNKPVFFKAFLLLPLSLLSRLTPPQLLFTLGSGEGGRGIPPAPPSLMFSCPLPSLSESQPWYPSSSNRIFKREKLPLHLDPAHQVWLYTSPKIRHCYKD